ncbi:nucleotidyltransferase domain-containing protein (plasmid) [Deinococcus taeanensis]|uniref:nucleotidyltransferase domain-containing protein n=1 Tax=Deinococcus taeanensis TaxID=2737050 RepID=UPI001CDC6518|nr:nucleotidyltransferase domain-containing protein [Deinococcus taeanensis]UBV45363.1 nucleotidyltransferase domain-containing protein [Deinococcus taeanensis]
MNFPGALTAAVQDHPYPLLFATISGAHLYGFPSPDSDWDLRGVHLLPAREVLGLMGGQETVQLMNDPRLEHLQMAPYSTEIELDLVTHDASKFFRLMLKRNGYVLEQLHSPLVVHTSPAHAELRTLAARCVTRHHAHHYLGFSANQWRLFAGESPPRVKPLLYTFRTLLTGLHLMKTGEIQANLGVLNEEARLPYLDELMAQKRSGAEKEPFRGDAAFFEQEFQRLTRQLEEARDASHLPGEVGGETTRALSNLLVTLRLKDLT